jgi:hypothetical protein
MVRHSIASWTESEAVWVLHVSMLHAVPWLCMQLCACMCILPPPWVCVSASAAAVPAVLFEPVEDADGGALLAPAAVERVPGPERCEMPRRLLSCANDDDPKLVILANKDAALLVRAMILQLAGFKLKSIPSRVYALFRHRSGHVNTRKSRLQ